MRFRRRPCRGKGLLAVCFLLSAGILTAFLCPKAFFIGLAVLFPIVFGLYFSR